MEPVSGRAGVGKEGLAEGCGRSYSIAPGKRGALTLAHGSLHAERDHPAFVRVRDGELFATDEGKAWDGWRCLFRPGHIVSFHIQDIHIWLHLSCQSILGRVNVHQSTTPDPGKVEVWWLLTGRALNLAYEKCSYRTSRTQIEVIEGSFVSCGPACSL